MKLLPFRLTKIPFLCFSLYYSKEAAVVGAKSHTMKVEAFLQAVKTAARPPMALTPELTVLWLAESNEWDRAHDLAQEITTKQGSWLHGHLHREEGDLGNASYWYHRARQPMPKSSISIAEERKALIAHFLNLAPKDETCSN